ncbi:MAB_1171c family putative transporter [Dactylosporangium sp. CA-092794]|uniref:MAB_1171c family putative transporter n=1 Tax=Dactylosporangium sp. CA-092794 TaxID=3239929 RepID=UPI003D91DE63
MNGLLYPLAAALAWIALAYRLVRGLRQDRRDPSLYSVGAAFALLGIIFTVSTPAVWARIDRVVAIPNLSLLISQGCVIAFSGTIQCIIIFWTHPRPGGWRLARRRIAWVLVVLVAMTVLFTAAGRQDEHPTDAAATYAQDPVYAAYLGCYIAMVALGFTDIVRLCLPYARAAGRVWLSRGLRLTAAGAGLGLLYCVVRAATLVEGRLGTDPKRLEALVPIFAALGAMLVIVGLTLPSFGPRLSRVAAWHAQRRAYRRMYPLWEAVTVTVPEVVLDPPASPGRGILRHVDRRLRRRVVEIGDGLRQLRHQMSEPVAGRPQDAAAQILVAGLAHEAERRARFDASVAGGTAGETSRGDEPQRRARWDAWRAALPAIGLRSTTPAGAGARPTGSGVEHEDFSAEVRRLVAVARALRGSSIPAAEAADPADIGQIGSRT